MKKRVLAILISIAMAAVLFCGTASASGAAPVITTTSLPDVHNGIAYSATLAADSDTPVTWSLESGDLPGGFVLSSDGIISGTSDGVLYKSYITFRATNSYGYSTQGLVIQNQPGEAPVITTNNKIQDGLIGRAYSQTFSASGDTPVTWSIIGLPEGLTMSSAGVISGIPKTRGYFIVSVTAENAVGSSTKNFYANIWDTTYSITQSENVVGGIVTLEKSTGILPNESIVLSIYSDSGYSFTSAKCGSDEITPGKCVVVDTPASYCDYFYQYTFTMPVGNVSITDVVFTPLTVYDGFISTSYFPGGEVGTPYSTTLTSTSGTSVSWILFDGELPGGLTLSGDTVSGTPTKSGDYQVLFLAESSPFYAISLYHIIIGAPPAITTETLSGNALGTAYYAVLAADNSQPITWSITSGSLPSGLTMSESGIIYGTASTLGKAEFTVKAENAYGSDTKELSITVAAPLSITTTSLPDGTTGNSYSETLAATGTSPVWSIDSGSLPAGLNLSEDGIISGTPSTIGNYSFTVRAENAAGSVTKALSIAVSVASAPIYTAPNITTTTLPDGTVNMAYSQTLTATGTATITWSVTAGALPGGLTLSPAGVISGTPTATGTFNFTVQAENSEGSDTQALSIVVSTAPEPIGTAPHITTTALTDATLGSSYSDTLIASGTAPFGWGVTDGSLPDGLSLDDITGVISGTPTRAGIFNFIAMVENVAGSDTKALSITVGVPITGLPISQTIYNGGRFTLNLQPAGGILEYDKAFFSVVIESTGTLPTQNTTTSAAAFTTLNMATSTAAYTAPDTATFIATFTALKSGTSTITYTVGGISQSMTVTIQASTLPKTGQDFTWAWLFAVIAVLVLAGGMALKINQRRKKI